MCPNFQKKTCEIAGIEPEKIKCVGEECCLSNEWEECKVYISQFFVHDGDEIAVAA